MLAELEKAVKEAAKLVVEVSMKAEFAEKELAAAKAAADAAKVAMEAKAALAIALQAAALNAAQPSIKGNFFIHTFYMMVMLCSMW